MNVRECRDTSDGNNITPRNPPKVKIGVQKTLAAKQADKSKLKKLGYTKRHIYAKSKWMGPNKFFFFDILMENETIIVFLTQKCIPLWKLEISLCH